MPNYKSNTANQLVSQIYILMDFIHKKTQKHMYLWVVDIIALHQAYILANANTIRRKKTKHAALGF